MKKTIILLLIVFFTVVRLRAQDNFSRWTVGFSAGPSIPIGRFASRNPRNTATGDGFALTGFGVELTGGYRLNRSFGLVLLTGGQENKYDPPPTLAPLNNWKIGRFLAGGSYTHPLAAHGGPSLQVRLLAGALKTSIPGFSSTSPGPNYSEQPEISLPWTFCYQADAGLKWTLSPKLSLSAIAGYTGDHPILREPAFSDAGWASTQPYHYSMGSVQLRAGIEMRL